MACSLANLQLNEGMLYKCFANVSTFFKILFYPQMVTSLLEVKKKTP